MPHLTIHYPTGSRDMPPIHRSNDYSDPTRKPRVLKYPWHVWFSRYPRHFILRKRRDYHIRSHAMEQQIRNMAAQPHWRLKVGCSVSQDEQSVTVHVYGKIDEE